MSNQLQITGGAKVRNLEGVLTGTSGVVSSLGINVPSGIPQLDGSGKILVSQLPNSVMEYKGTWDASTNTPTLANGTGNQGDVYLCSAAGTVNFGAGPITFAVGDQVIYSGSIWQKAGGATGTVTSVSVTESGDALTITGSPITTSGTINIGFAGSSTQYVAGDGTLVTFPTIITEAQNLITDVYNETGATLTKGTVVYINGGHGNLPIVTKAIATGDATSAQTYGVVQADITNNNNGHVVVIGSLGNLDTQAYAAGTQLYLSSTTAGAYTSTKQYAPAHLVYVGIVTRSHPTQGIIEVKIQNGFEMDELHNVSAQSPANNDGLFYNTSTSLWETKSIATALGYTPANAATYVPYTGATGSVVLGTSNNLTASTLFTSATADGGLWMTQASAITGGESSTTYTSIKAYTNRYLYFSFGQTSDIKRFRFDINGLTASTTRTYTMPDADGTIALTSDLSNYVTIGTTQTITGAKTFNTVTTFNQNVIAPTLTINSSSGILIDTDGSGNGGALKFTQNTSTSVGGPTQSSLSTNGQNKFYFYAGVSSGVYRGFYLDNSLLSTNTVRTYQVPNASGTLALTSDIPTSSTYVDLTSAQTITGIKTFTNEQLFGNGITLTGGYITYKSGSYNLTLNTNLLTANRNVFLQDKAGTIALTSDLTGGTVTSVGLSSATSGVTIGSSPITTSGTITLSIATASGSQQGLLSSTDWTSFNNKQNALTNPITGTGTTNTHAKFTGSTTLGNSMLSDDGTTLTSAGATRSNLYLKATSNSYYSQLAFTNGTNGSFGGISYNNSGQYMQFETNSSEWARLNSNGNFLIGTTSDNGSKLQVSGAATFSSTIDASGTITGNGVSIGASDIRSTSGTLTLGGTTEIMRLNSTGVGIKTSSPEVDLQVGANSGTPRTFSLRYSSVPLYMSNTWTGTYSKAVLSINYYDTSNGSSSISSFSNVNYAAGSIELRSAVSGSDILFNTITSVNTAPTERMRITSSGSVFINTTSANITSNMKLSVKQTLGEGAAEVWTSWAGDVSTAAFWVIKYDNVNSSSQIFQRFAINNGGTANGQINGNGASQVAFGSYSDIRLKENITKLEGQLDKILSLKPCEFDYIDGSGHQIGFIAQEVQEVYPDVVNEGDDGMLTLSGWNKTEARLVKAIQESYDIIKKLEERIVTLESKIN